MDETQQEKFVLSIWLPAGIVLIVLGLLTLATPLLAYLDNRSLFIDMVSGSILFVAGVVSIARSRKR